MKRSYFKSFYKKLSKCVKPTQLEENDYQSNTTSIIKNGIKPTSAIAVKNIKIQTAVIISRIILYSPLL